MQCTHCKVSFCTSLWPSRPGLHVLISQTQRHISLEGNIVPCFFTPQQQGCSTGCGKPCSASPWLPSTLVSGVLHYILHSNPDSKGERSMAMYPAWWAVYWEALYFIFPHSQTNFYGFSYWIIGGIYSPCVQWWGWGGMGSRSLMLNIKSGSSKIKAPFVKKL